MPPGSSPATTNCESLRPPAPVARRKSTCPIAIDARTEYETWRERNALDEAACSERELRTQLFVVPAADQHCLSGIQRSGAVPAGMCRLGASRSYTHHGNSSLPMMVRTGPTFAGCSKSSPTATRGSAFCFLSRNSGIALATNAALAQAAGEFVGFLDHDDELAPDALYEVASELNHERDWDVFYSDEDKIAPDGRHVEPFFKPGWSPDLLLAVNYVCHFLVCRRSLIDALDGLRSDSKAARISISRCGSANARQDQADSQGAVSLADISPVHRKFDGSKTRGIGGRIESGPATSFADIARRRCARTPGLPISCPLSDPRPPGSGDYRPDRRQPAARTGARERARKQHLPELPHYRSG